MRLGESIELGSTVVKPMAGVLLAGAADKAGCALGMAIEAVGHVDGEPVPYLAGESGHEYRKRNRTVNMELFWPWLAHSIPFPCMCFSHRSSRCERGKDVVAHIFDAHVFGKQDWTFKQLLEFVRSIEPAEEIDPELAEQYRAEEEAAAEEGAEIEARGYRDPASDRRFA